MLQIHRINYPKSYNVAADQSEGSTVIFYLFYSTSVKCLFLYFLEFIAVGPREKGAPRREEHGTR